MSRQGSDTILERRHQWQRRVSHILEEKLFRLTAINRVNPGLCRHEDPVANRRAIFGQLHQVIEFEVGILFADRDPECVALLCSPVSRDSFKPLQKIMRGRLAADGFAGSPLSDKINIILGSEFLRDSSSPLASTAAVSLQSADRVIGCLGVGSTRPNAFTPDDLALLDMFALQTAAVMENTLLHEHNAVLAAAIEHLSDAVLLTDLDELVIHANPAANSLFAIPLEELRGHRARRIFSPRFPPEQIEQIFEATRAGGWNGESIALRAKTDFPMDLRTALVRARKGAPIAMVFLCKDLSNQKQVEKERLQAAELATLLETAIALNHEINNPLQVILTCAQLLQFQLKDHGQDTHEKLTMIVDQSQRIAEVTHKLEQAKAPVRRNYVLGQAMIDIEESAKRQ
jgi:PAS domain S-box-containing protein